MASIKFLSWLGGWWLGALAASGAFVLLPEESRPKDKPFAEAVELYEKGDYRKAAAAFQRQADAGQPAAMLVLAAMISRGEGFTADPVAAEKWLKKGADKNYPPALLELGELNLRRPDQGKAGLELIRQAAEKGSVTAMGRLGQLLADGAVSGQPDWDGAVNWLEQAMNKGRMDAAFQLAVCLEAPQYPKRDETKALATLQRAADAEFAPALLRLAAKYSAGQGVPKDEAKALGALQKAAELGSGSALFALGVRYETGQGVSRDEAKALSLYTRAAQDADDRELMGFNKLGYFHEQGLGVTKDESKAVEWYRKGAEAGVAVCMFNLGLMTESGRGTAKDEAAGGLWLRKAAYSGFAPAQFELAQRYRAGRGMTADPVAAQAWLDRSARNGWTAAQLVLGEMLEKGEAGVRDDPSAVAVYRLAANQGSAEAQFHLAQLLEAGRGVKEPDPVTATVLYQSVAKLNVPSGNDAAAALQGAAKKKATELSRSLSDAQRQELEKRLAPPPAASSAAPSAAPAATR